MNWGKPAVLRRGLRTLAGVNAMTLAAASFAQGGSTKPAEMKIGITN